MESKKKSKYKPLAVIEKDDTKLQLQSNEISRGIYSCSSMARRLIAFCISNAYQDTLFLSVIQSETDERKLKKMEMPCMVSEFTFNEFFDRLGLTKGERQIELIKNAVDECQRAIIKVENTPRKYHAYSWFIESIVDGETGKISMTFNPLIFKALTEWYITKKGYSKLKIEMLGKLRSFYAMRYYEIAISGRGHEGKDGNPKGTWFFQFTVDELRTMFEIKPTEYKGRLDNFTDKVVSTPINELNRKNEDFRIEPMKIKQGRKITGFRFVCYASNPKAMKIESSMSYEDKKNFAKTNDINAEIEKLSKKYPKRFRTILEEVKKQQNLPGLKRFEALDRQEAARILKEQLEEEKAAKAGNKKT